MREMGRRGMLRMFVVVSLVALAVVGLGGCRPATAAELQDWGTRTYAGTTKAQAYRASLAALRSLGYDIAATDNAAQIRTAPKLVTVTATGSQYSAQAVENSLAWDIDVTGSPQGIVIHATPRGYSAGQAVDGTHLQASYMKKAFETLFGEIERDLGVVGPAPPATKAASGARNTASRDGVSPAAHR